MAQQKVGLHWWGVVRDRSRGKTSPSRTGMELMRSGLRRYFGAGAALMIAVMSPAVAHAESVGRTVDEYGSIFVVLGVVATAYLLSYLLLQWLSQRYGFVTGVPYIVLGIVAVPVTGWLSPEMMQTVEPLVALAVAAVALAAGLQINAKNLVDRESTTVKLALTVAAVTLVMVVVVPFVGLSRWPPPLEDAIWLPALLALGAIALVADGRPLKALAAHLELDEDAVDQAGEVAWLSTMLAVLIFGVAFSIYNPGEPWRGGGLDAGLWLVAHLAAGGVFGAVGGAMIQARPDDDRVLTILVGVVLTAGALAYVTTLSIVFVNFVAGVVLINMSGESLRFRQMLDSANSPLYVLLLFFAGTMWTVGLPPWVYAAVAVYLVLRVLGRLLGVAAYRPRLSGYRPEPGMYRALIAPGALTAAMILDFGFGFGHGQFEAATIVVSGFVLILIAEEVISFVLLRGWLIDISDVGSARHSTSPWGDWKGDR